MSTERKLSDAAIAAIRAGIKRALKIPQGFDMESFGFPKHDAPCGTGGCLAFEIAVADGVDPKNIQLWDSVPVSFDLNKLDHEDRAEIEDQLDAIVEEHKRAQIDASDYAADLIDPEGKIRSQNVVTGLGLFFPSYWPYELHARYEAAKPYSRERVEVAAEAAEAWIAGDGSFAYPEMELVK